MISLARFESQSGRVVLIPELVSTISPEVTCPKAGLKIQP